MTMDLVDSLRNQIAQCWSPPAARPIPDELVVDFDLFSSIPMAPSHRRHNWLQTLPRAASNPYMRAAAEAARRAIYDMPPYKLPADRYNQWREIDPIDFDPRQMMGQ